MKSQVTLKMIAQKLNLSTSTVSTFKSNAEIFAGIGFLTANPTLQGYIDADKDQHKVLEETADFMGGRKFHFSFLLNQRSRPSASGW